MIPCLANPYASARACRFSKSQKSTVRANLGSDVEPYALIQPAPVDGTYLLDASLTCKTNGNASVRIQGRLLLNGLTAISGTTSEITGTHNSETTTLPLQTLTLLNVGDTVELKEIYAPLMAKLWRMRPISRAPRSVNPRRWPLERSRSRP